MLLSGTVFHVCILLRSHKEQNELFLITDFVIRSNNYVTFQLYLKHG